MKTTMTIQVRAFPVLYEDRRTGERQVDRIVLSKQQLQAAQIVGQSSKELIERAYARKGYRAVVIGKAERQEITLDLEGLYLEAVGSDEERREAAFREALEE